MAKEKLETKKVVYFECKACGITHETPCSLWINEKGKPECTSCGRMLIRRVRNEPT